MTLTATSAIAALALLALCALCSAAPAAPRSDGPAFCHGLDCPKYTLLNKTANYEVRRYDAGGKYASVTIESVNFTQAVDQGFHMLFDYISGANARQEKIEMTAPVVNDVTPGAGPFCRSTFVISFFIPFAVQSNPPAPTNAQVKVVTRDAFTVYVSSFGGFASADDVVQQAAALAQNLANDNISFNQTYYTSAGYDGPYRLVDRHNEVWFHE